MRTSIIILLFFLLCTNSFSQEMIIEKNADHVIYYSIQGNMISFFIEDLLDNQDNTRVTRYGGLGNGEICGVPADGNSLTDACIIEVDYNQNKLVDNGLDLGYIIANDYRTYSHKPNPFYSRNPMKYLSEDNILTYVTPYYLKKNTPILTFKTYTTFDNPSSLSLGFATWTSSKFGEQDHLIYKFEMPVNEIISKMNGFANLRFIILRVSSIKDGNYYGTFYYPKQNCMDKDSILSYAVDLTKTNVYKKLLEKKTVKNQRGAYTLSQLQKSTLAVPEWEGVYVKINTGKYVELNYKIIFNYGGMYNPYTNPNIMYKPCTLGDFENVQRDPKYFICADEIDTNRKIISIKSSSLNSFLLCLASSDPKILSNVTLRKYNEYMLSENGSEMFYPLNKNKGVNVSNTFGIYLSRQKIYFAGEIIGLKRISNGNKFSYIPMSPLEPGIYSFSYDYNDGGHIVEIVK